MLAQEERKHVLLIDLDRHPYAQGKIRRRLRRIAWPHSGDQTAVRNEKTLIALLRGLVQLLAEESAQNPEFASKIERLLSDLPERKVTKKVPPATKPTRAPLPDVHTEWNARGETSFRLWLREQPIPVLRAVIRAQDLDPTRRTAKWKKAEKLAEFIADNVRARLSRALLSSAEG
jgi:hypothetical protein